MSVLPDPATTIELSVEDVERLAPGIVRGEIVLLDCRGDDEWRFNRLPGARFAPLSNFAAESAAALPDPSTPCVVYCHHGMRSLSAVRWLRGRGHEKAWSMRGGIHAWSERVDPTVPKY